jgi:hypothetical protein
LHFATNTNGRSVITKAYDREAHSLPKVELKILVRHSSPKGIGFLAEGLDPVYLQMYHDSCFRGLRFMIIHILNSFNSYLALLSSYQRLQFRTASTSKSYGFPRTR